MHDYLIHKTWVYPSLTLCSCDDIAKSISITVADEKMILVARDIVKRIEDEMDYPGQIKVNLIRESRAVEYAK